MLNGAPLPVVFLPGTLCDGRVFGPQLAALKRPVQVVPIAGARDAATMAQLVLEQAPERFALCGFSLGAIVALEVVAQAPERVDRLALLACNGRAVDPASVPGRRAAVETARRDGTVSHIAGSWDAAIAPEHRNDPKLRGLLETMARETLLATYEEQVEIAINRVDSRKRLHEIGVPVLVAGGAADGICPPAMSQEIAQALPDARLAILDGAGHYLSLEHPEAVTRLLADWLATRASPTPRISKETP